MGMTIDHDVYSTFLELSFASEILGLVHSESENQVEICVNIIGYTKAWSISPRWWQSTEGRS